MPDLYMNVDAALAEVPINKVPLIDDTDFKTREESVVYNQAGLDLVWNFITTAGAYTQTAVTPTDTAGVYDWINQGNGMYSIEIPASGGGTINNDTEGFGWFTGFATGILPWTGPIIGFRAAGLNNLLIDGAYSATRGLTGTALPGAPADAAGGLVISDAGGLNIDDMNAAAVRLTAVRAAVLTDWINDGRLDLLLDAIPTTAMRGTDSAYTGTPPTVIAIRQEMDSNSADLNTLITNVATLLTRLSAARANNLDEITAVRLATLTDWINNGRLDLLLDAIPTTAMRGTDSAYTGGNITGNLSGSVGSVAGNVDGSIGSLGATAKADVNAEVDTALADYDGPTKAEMDTAHALLATAAALTTHDGKLDIVDGVVDAIKVITDALTAAAAAKLALSAGTIVSGAAEAGTLSTTQMSTDVSEITDDHFNGRIIIWTSGVLQNQATDITDYVGTNGVLTFTAVTEAPSAADTFIIV